VQIPSPIEEIVTDWSAKAEIQLFIKRDDLIHPLISGNKFRKLKYNLIEAKEKGHKTILSFGGAYSNHIHALAAACKHDGFKSAGIIRGDEIRPLNKTLQFAEDAGMELFWISREEYRNKSHLGFVERLRNRFGDFYLIPEGGTNQLAIKGTSEIIPEINFSFDYICTAVGTGGTVAGLISSAPFESKVLGFSALKGDFIKGDVARLLPQGNVCKYEINTNFHFGGYAKVKSELWNFLDEFKKQTEIQLEPVYNGKMMFGIQTLCNNGYFRKGQKVVALHTGGLQGLAGFNR